MHSRYFIDVYSPKTYEEFKKLDDDELLFVEADTPYKTEKTRLDAQRRLTKHFKGAKILFDGKQGFFIVPKRVQKRRKRKPYTIPPPNVLVDTKQSKHRRPAKARSS